MARPLINVPVKVKRGETFEIKTMIFHVMEPGYRFTTIGTRILRDIVTSFSCNYSGLEVFRADFSLAIAADPFITFFTVATESGTLEFKWTGDNGFSETVAATITVE